MATLTSADVGRSARVDLGAAQRTGLSRCRRAEPPRVAYMIYTSGTTGTPKGVQIGNGAFAAAVALDGRGRSG